MKTPEQWLQEWEEYKTIYPGRRPESRIAAVQEDAQAALKLDLVQAQARIRELELREERGA